MAVCPGGVVVGGNYSLLPEPKSVTVEVAADGPSEHYARPIVVAEQQRPLDRACRMHDCAGARGHHHLTGRAAGGVRAGVVTALDERGALAVVKPKHGRAAQNLDLRQRLKFSDKAAAQDLPSALDRCRAAGCRRAESPVRPASRAQPAAPGGQRGGKAGGTRTNYQHVGEGMPCVIAVGIRAMARLDRAPPRAE